MNSFEDRFTSIRGNVEVVNIELGREVGWLPLRARRQIDQPEILMSLTERLWL
jgi:hypothetical protein